MRTKLIVLIAISLLMIGCAPPTQIQKIHIRLDQQNTGDVDVFNSFDEVGRSYKKVAEIESTDSRPLNTKNRNRLIESLKSMAGELGAQGIVIVKEGESVTTMSMPAGGGPTDVYSIFMDAVAIVYE